MKVLEVLLLAFLISNNIFANEYKLFSPDKKISLKVEVKENLLISIKHENDILLNPSIIDISIDGKTKFKNAKIHNTKRDYISRKIVPVIPIKTEVIVDEYNELSLNFKNDMSVVFRVYNNGVAYRMVSHSKKKNVIVNDEIISLDIPRSSYGFLMKENSFLSMSESPYICKALNGYENSSMFSLPALFKVNDKFLEVLESDVNDFPGLWIIKDKEIFKSAHPHKVLETKSGVCFNEQYVTKRADYIAETIGNRKYPWRIFAIASKETELINNQLVYLLSTPALEYDYSWIQPGIAILDWWGRRNIYGTNFVGGVNTDSHKYFVDFVSRYGLKYFVLDDGWSDACDLRKVNENLDLDELREYAEKKNVGLIYWVHAYALKQDVSGYMDFFESIGAKGLKVDFFNRDDQDAVNLFHEIASEALKRKLIIDFHGICKPIGLNRTYPNVLTSEGLIEFEMNGVTDWDNPVHHTLLPFIRMVAGPMDYLPCTLNNAQRHEFYMNVNRPVGLGSRAHSIALSVLYESPITMIPDSPSDYINMDDCTSFLSKIPTVWDETVPIDGKIGEFVVLARRKGDIWFLSAITNWEKRELNIKLDFLPKGDFQVEAIVDGVNTGVRAIDYKKIKIDIDNQTTIPMSLSQGGGWVGIITPKK